MKACACSDQRSWAFIRDDLDAPDRLRGRAPEAPDPAGAGAYPDDPGAEGVEDVEGDAAAVPAPSPVDPAPQQSAPRGPPQPREAPQAKKDEEAVFF